VEPAPSSSETDLHQRLREVGDHPVTSPAVAVITRFRLRGPQDLLPTYRAYRQVLLEARRSQTPGLLRASFLIENPSTWYSLSLWADANAIGHFGTNAPGHVEAANRIFGRVRYDEHHDPEIWSTKWRLQSVSNNLSWEGFDLRGLLAGTEEGDHADR
jgi:hypothetical protein